eukprot:EG_transcript_10557
MPGGPSASLDPACHPTSVQPPHEGRRGLAALLLSSGLLLLALASLGPAPRAGLLYATTAKDSRPIISTPAAPLATRGPALQVRHFPPATAALVTAPPAVLVPQRSRRATPASTPPTPVPLLLLGSALALAALVRWVRRPTVAPAVRSPAAVALWATAGERLEVEVGAIVVWSSPISASVLFVGRVEAAGVEVAGQPHWNVREYDPIDPLTFVPSPERPRPVMARKLRAVPYVAGEVPGSVRIDQSQMFALTRAAEGWGPSVVRDPAAIAGEYQQRREALFKDATVITAVTALLVLANADPAYLYPYLVGAAGGLAYLSLLMLYADALGQDQLRTNWSRLRFALPVLVMLVLALGARASEGVTLEAAAQMLSEDPWAVLRLLHVAQADFLAAVCGFLSPRLPLFWAALQEIGAAILAEIAAGQKGASLGDAIRDRYNPRRRK